jgi:peptidylprolyl isomerase
LIKRIILPCIAVLSLVLLIAACSDDGDDDGDTNDAAPTSVESNTDNGESDGACTPSGEQFDGPETVIDESKTYVATITLVDGGEIEVELFSDVPVTTNNFVFLAQENYYDCVTFHRVITDFMAQGGDPTGTGSGGPGYSIPDEDSAGHRMEAGVISMAKAGPNTTGSQFFITYTPQPQLEADFTVFGTVISGMDVVDGITPRNPQDPNAPLGDQMLTITIEES